MDLSNGKLGTKEPSMQITTGGKSACDEVIMSIKNKRMPQINSDLHAAMSMFVDVGQLS